MSASTLGAFDVKDYGATGNGSTDDRAAIQSAIDAAQTAGGGTVFFPTGIYHISSGLNITHSAMHLLGENAYIIVTYSSGDVITMTGPGASAAPGTDDYYRDLSVRGLHFYGQHHTSGTALRLSYVRNIMVADCSFLTLNTLAELGTTNQPDNVQQFYLLNCHIGLIEQQTGSALKHGISLNSGAAAVIRDCTIEGLHGATGNQSFISQHETATNWDGLVVSGCTVAGWPRFITVTGHGIANARIDGNLVEPDLKKAAVALFPTDNCQSWVIDSNVFNCEGSESYGIRLAKQSSGQTRDVVVSNNIIRYAGQRGIDLQSGCKNVSIVGNVLRACGTSGREAIHINGDNTAISVTGNTTDPAGTAMTYGIIWEGNSNPSRAQAGNGIIAGTSGQIFGSP